MRDGAEMQFAVTHFARMDEGKHANTQTLPAYIFIVEVRTGCQIGWKIFNIAMQRIFAFLLMID